MNQNYLLELMNKVVSVLMMRGLLKKSEQSIQYVNNTLITLIIYKNPFTNLVQLKQYYEETSKISKKWVHWRCLLWSWTTHRYSANNMESDCCLYTIDIDLYHFLDISYQRRRMKL